MSIFVLFVPCVSIYIYIYMQMIYLFIIKWLKITTLQCSPRCLKQVLWQMIGEHQHSVSNKYSILLSQKLFYQLYHTILQFTQHLIFIFHIKTNTIYLFIHFFDFSLSSSPSLSLYILFMKSNNIENHNYIPKKEPKFEEKNSKNQKKYFAQTHQSTTITKLQIPTTSKNNHHHHCQLSTTITKLQTLTTITRPTTIK